MTSNIQRVNIKDTASNVVIMHTTSHLFLVWEATTSYHGYCTHCITSATIVQYNNDKTLSPFPYGLDFLFYSRDGILRLINLFILDTNKKQHFSLFCVLFYERHKIHALKGRFSYEEKTCCHNSNHHRHPPSVPNPPST